MEITIKEILEKKNTPFIIFESELGIGEGFWDGKPPSVGKKYSVEFEISDKFIWGKNIHKTDEKVPLLNLIDNNFIIRGMVEEIYDDGIIILRLTPSSSIMLEVNDDDQLKTGDFIKITIRQARIFDSNY